MPSDWKTFKPTRLPSNSKHITVRPSALYITKTLVLEMGEPDFVKFRINDKLQAFSVTPVAESDPAAVRVSTRNTIKSAELASAILMAMKAERVRLKAQKNPNGNSWVFQLKFSMEGDMANVDS